VGIKQFLDGKIKNITKSYGFTTYDNCVISVQQPYNAAAYKGFTGNNAYDES